MQRQGDTPDAVTARIAARQHGVIALRQLLAAGMTKGGAAHRVSVGRLHRVHRGVYAVGYPRLTHAGRCMAGALACGASAVVSHRSAAELWRLLPVANRPIDVSVPGVSGKKKRSGIHVHRSRTLTAEMTATHRDIPVTTPARTIADLRLAPRIKGCPAAVSPSELRRAIREAAVLGLEIDRPEEAERTRSELERLFLRLCERHRIPTPEVNVRVDSFLVDFLWRDRRLIVETDGYRYHRGRAAFEGDRERDLQLKSLGYEVMRLTYRQLADESNRIAGTLKALLQR
jgi:very-short-patch-repair endonuclease